MTVTTQIPPQAYTRDTLVKAIEWMATQPAIVRERANSADLLVSYYLQAARKSAAQMEAPISQENFKTDLKHLAADLKKFEEPMPPPNYTTAPSNRSPAYGYAEPIPSESVYRIEPAPRFEAAPRFDPAPRFEPPPRLEAVRGEAPPQPQQRQEPPLNQRPEPAKAPNWTIDARSLGAARDLQQRLNLGSEVEALRMLVTLGAERARDLFGS